MHLVPTFQKIMCYIQRVEGSPKTSILLSKSYLSRGRDNLAHIKSNNSSEEREIRILIQYVWRQ